MSFRILIVLLILFAFAGTVSAAQPNIILIMSDDMGYSDIGCYGGEIETPCLDRLAKGGVRFTQFYNTARCCPTRASLLTGLHPHQAGIGHMVNDQKLPGYRGDLSSNAVTIAEVLRSANYRNYQVGKWHVTDQLKPTDSQHNWPLQRGFDRGYTLISGGANYFDPFCLVRDNTPISALADPEYKPNEYYLTHAISDHAVRFVKEHKAQTPDKPFFMYVAYTAAHWPMQAPEKAATKNKGKYDTGYTPVREARFARMREMGLLDDRWELSPQAQRWEDVENKPWESRCMEVYAAMITEMDHGIGQIVDALKETGLYENTVVMYLQDNGACAEEVGRQKNGKTVHPDKPEFEPVAKEEIINERAFFDSRTRDGFALRKGVGTMPGPRDTFVAYGRGWANASNTPYREYKHWVHEGGISTPLIVHAPSKVAESMRGKFYREPGQLPDLMATCVDLAGAKYPEKHNGNDIVPAEGTSLVPGFSGVSLKRTKPLVWEHEGNRAIRDGNWKLVAKGPQGTWELYDLEADRSEMHDLADKHPERVESMAKAWNDWAVRAKVLPWPWKSGNSDDIVPDTTPGLKLELDFTKKGKIVDSSGKNAGVSLEGKLENVAKKGSSGRYFDGGVYVDVEKSSALHCAETPWSVSATFESESPEGLIIAYGGSKHGYALYLKEGKPGFAVRIADKAFRAESPKAVNGSVTVKGIITMEQKAEIYVDGEKVASVPLPGFIATNPGEGMQIGTDLGGSVTGLKLPNFKGRMERIEIRREPTVAPRKISATDKDKPNIVFIYADDQTFSALGSLGHPIVKTPNLDRLAEQGTIFSNAYNQGGWHGAICVASRAMVNTGRFLWHAKTEMDRGFPMQKTHVDPSERNRYESNFWSRLLHDGGYETYFAGKWHVDEKNVDGKRIGCVSVEPLFDHFGIVRPGGMPPTVESSYNRPVEGDVDAWSPIDPKFEGHWSGGKHWAEALADSATEMIGTATKSDKPFFMYLAFNSPHDPRQAPKEFVDMYPEEKMDVPPNFLPENPFKDPMNCPVNNRDEKLAPFPRTEYAVRVHRREYYAIISHMDAQVGRILDALDKSGKRENTYIIFAADNGLAIGSHGLFGKQSMFEHSVKVPLIVAGPGLPKRKRIDVPVYMQDLVPTALDAAGEKIPEHVQFKSLLPLLRGERTEQHTSIYGAFQQHQRMVRQGDFKLILYPKSKTVLLFDVKNDPFETKNLADRPEHAPRIKELYAELKRLQTETGDPLELDFEF